MRFFQTLPLWLIIFFLVLPLKTPVLGIKFSLIAPTGELKRGDTARFTVNIDTKGETVKETQIGATYQSQYLEFVNAVPTDDFPNITVSRQSESSMIISGSNPNGFTGQGIFTYLDFKIIAKTSGSAQLCSLFTPSPPSSGYPSSSPTGPTSIPTYPQNTSIPNPSPTQTPPRSGGFDKLILFGFTGVLLILFRFVYNRTDQ